MNALIERANESDLKKILDLQYLAYQRAARLFNDKNIPPLTQTLDDLEREFCAGIILKAVRDDEIIGSVRGRVDAGTTYVGKLIVRPQCQGHGLGTRLLLAIEKHCVAERCELFTSTRSLNNLRLYERLGFKSQRRRRLIGGGFYVETRNEICKRHCRKIYRARLSARLSLGRG